jgi:hypothetical protein
MGQHERASGGVKGANAGLWRPIVAAWTPTAAQPPCLAKDKNIFKTNRGRPENV